MSQCCCGASSPWEKSGRFIKDKLLLGLLAAALGLALVGCENPNGFDDVVPSAYEPLVITGWFVDGSEVVIEISTERTVPRVVLSPANGDTYVLWVNGWETSNGTIKVDGTNITFYPSNNGASFTVYYYRGYPVTLYELPTQDGGLINGYRPGGPFNRPPSDVTARTGAETVSAFGGSRYATVNSNGSVTVNSTPPLIATNLTIRGVSVVFDSDGEGPMTLSIAPGKFLTIISDTNNNASMAVKDTSLEITGGGTLYIDKSTLRVSGDDAKLTVSDGAITVGAGSAVTINDGAELAVSGGDIDIYSKVIVEFAAMNVSSGSVNVHNIGSLVIDEDSTLDLAPDPALRARAVEDPPKLNINDGGIVDVSAGSWNVIPGSVTISEQGQFITSSGNNQAGLNDAVEKVKTAMIRGATIQLTEDFYYAANAARNYITVDAAPDANTVPYTVKGSNEDTLNVGIWLANDNVTLEGVTFDITTSAATTMQAAFGGSAYYPAILIARSMGGGNISGPSNSVTIQSCNITVMGGIGFTAGIWVEGDPQNEGFDSEDVNGGRNIAIRNNYIDATAYGSSTVAALGIRIWEPTTIIGNELYARYDKDRPFGITPGTSPVNTPASGLFINAIHADTGFGNSAISDNIYSSGSDPWEKELLSFFVNIYPPKGQQPSFDMVTDNDLLQSGFGSKDTALWLTTLWLNNGSSSTTKGYKLLCDALVADISDQTDAFGTVGMAVDWTPAWVREFYQYKNGALTYVSYWGYDVQKDEEGIITGYKSSSSDEIFGGFKPNGDRPSDNKDFHTYFDQWWEVFSTPKYETETTPYELLPPDTLFALQSLLQI